MSTGYTLLKHSVAYNDTQVTGSTIKRMHIEH